MMTYVDDNENIDLVQRSIGRAQMHTPSLIAKDYKLKKPTYMICSVEKSVKMKALGVKNNKGGDLQKGDSIFRFVMVQTIM